MPRVGILAAVEIRPLKNADGRSGELLQLGDIARLVVVHNADGSAELAVVDANGRTKHEWHFKPEVMDVLVDWAAGPARLEDDEESDSLKFCSACFNGRCKDCKGADACECDHTARNALAEEGPKPE